MSRTHLPCRRDVLVVGDQSLRHPVIYLHGIPGSRREATVLAEPAERLGISILSIDRPGYGAAPPSPHRALREVGYLASKVADLFQIRRYALLGVSGGAPFALACAHTGDPRLRATALVSGLGECSQGAHLRGMQLLNRLVFSAAFLSPLLCRALLTVIVSAYRALPTPFVHRVVAPPSREDRSLLTDPLIASAVVENFGVAVRTGFHGTHRDLALLTRPWGFALEEVASRVHLWHGTDDRSVPCTMAHGLAARLPNAKATLIPGWGHLMGIHFAPQILATLREELEH